MTDHSASDRRGPLRQLLETEYGCRAPRLTPFYESPHKAIYRVDHVDGPPWVLRHYPSNRPLERLSSQAAIMRYLAGQGVPMEQIILTRDGADCAVLDGRGVLVTTCLEGGTPRRSPETLRRLGESVGLLHALPSVPHGDPQLSRPARAMPREDVSVGFTHLDQISSDVPGHLAAAHAALRAALQSTRTGDHLPPACHGLVHNDCHLANATEAADGHISWFDWDGVGHGPRVAALGVLLYSCAIQAPDEPARAAQSAQPAADPAVEARVAAVLAGYSTYHRLTAAELDYLPDAVRFRPAAAAARELAQAVESDRSPDPAGWWARYAEADYVAACARRVIG